ncbi:MAG: DUF6504 family protein [Anaerolineales bacterium]|nr:DUF6504 family protein [Anaerolineales bacterium]
MDHKPVRFIGEQIEVLFDKQPLHMKKPGCPDGFTWQAETYHVVKKVGEWQDYSRRGDMAHNMRPANAAKALRRGSWGVGRFYFRIQTGSGQIFDIYYDRAPKNAADREGAWFLYREMSESAG